MELTFSSGTSEQKKLYEDALGLLMHLPVDALPLAIDVSFVPPEEVGQTNFAETTWEYGSTESTTRVRNDAPGFGNIDAALIAEATREGLRYDARLHFNETAAHELGHSVFAALPEETRLAICALFGVNTDDDDVLFPEDADWHDRPGEGIADTFKEAFLPSRFRVFPNRTNVKISYSKYPTFRRLIREAIPQMEATGELPPGETAVPGYNLDIFGQGEVVFEGPFANPLANPEGKKGLWQSSFGNIESGPGLHNSNMQQLFEWEGWIKDGTVLNWSFVLPLAAMDFSLIGSPYFEPASFLQQYNDCGYSWILVTRKSPFAAEEVLYEGQWARTVKDAETAEAFPDIEFVSPNWTLYRDARGHGVPTTTVSGSIVVNGTNYTQTLVCKGSLYRRVWLTGNLATLLTMQLPETDPEQERLRQDTTYTFMPHLTFSQNSCQGGSGETGQEIVIPPGLITPGDYQTGVHPTKRPVVGH